MPARDYKHRRAPREPVRRGAPGWVWLLAGLAIGLFVAVLVYLREHHPARVPAAAGAPAPAAAAPEAPRRPPPPKPRYEFYTILPEMEVPVPERELAPRRAAPAPRSPAAQPPPAEPAGARYLVQVGSFRGLSDADRLKARLALQGLEAEIQTVTVNGKTTWHRVRLGPYASLPQASAARARLRRQGLQAIVLRVKG